MVCNGAGPRTRLRFRSVCKKVYLGWLEEFSVSSVAITDYPIEGLMDEPRESVTVAQGNPPCLGLVVQGPKVATIVEFSTASASPRQRHEWLMSDECEQRLLAKVQGEGCKAKYGYEAMSSY